LRSGFTTTLVGDNQIAFQQARERRTLDIHPRTVAIVEDDPSMGRSIERLLNAHGFATEVYPSAASFLSRKLLSLASCVVLDIQFDGMSGIELQHKLRESGIELPVIFITASDDKELERRGIEAGCVAYLHKPFPGKLLLDAINQI
jgi:FixJ family two-component response regulator